MMQYFTAEPVVPRRMFMRALAILCIVSALATATLGIVLVWGSQPTLLGQMFATSLLTFLASGSIFSVLTSLGRHVSKRSERP